MLSEMENSFARILYKVLGTTELDYTDFFYKLKKVLEENNLTVVSKPLPSEAIAASINPSKYKDSKFTYSGISAKPTDSENIFVSNSGNKNLMSIMNPKFVWQLRYKSLELLHPQTVEFESEYQLTCFLTGLGSNPKICQIEIEKFSV